MTALLIIILVLCLVILFLAYGICKTGKKFYPDKNNPNIWRDDEGNEYEF